MKWQERIARCYDTWKSDFDSWSMNVMLSLSGDSSQRARFLRFATSTAAIYHAAHITLTVEILDLQIYAGARHIIGRYVSRADYDRSRRAVKTWASLTNTSCKATVQTVGHAAQLLRDGILNLEHWDVDGSFHYPWCLYLATLTCWAFHYSNISDAKSSPAGDRFATLHRSDATPAAMEDSVLAEAKVMEARAGMIGLVNTFAGASSDTLWSSLGRTSPDGLNVVIAKHLSNIRWAVIHEAMKVLRGLTT